MATLLIVKMIHMSAEMPRTLVDIRDNRKNFCDLGLQHIWLSHFKKLRKYGLWSIYSTRKRRVFLEGLTNKPPLALQSSKMKRWYVRNPKAFRKLPALQMVISGMAVGQILTPCEERLKLAACKRSLQRKRTRANSLHSKKSIRDRDRVIAKNIMRTLSSNAIGVLYVGNAHNVKAELARMHSSIKVVELNIVQPKIEPLPLKGL